MSQFEKVDASYEARSTCYECVSIVHICTFFHDAKLVK